MGKSQREKGKRGERELAQLFRACGFRSARRGAQHRGGPDSPDVLGLPGFHVECKRAERLSLYKALGQAFLESAEHERPIVFYRHDAPPGKSKDEEWVAILRAIDMLEIVRELQNLLEEKGKTL